MSLFSNIFKSSQLPADQDGLFSGKNRFHAVNYKNEKPTLFSARRNYSATKSSLDGSLDGSSTEAKVQRKKKHKDIRSIDKPVAESETSKKRSREKNNARKVSALHETEKTDRGAATSKKKRKVYTSEEPSPAIEKELNKDQEKKKNLDPAEKETSVRSGKQTLSLQEVKRLKRTIFVGNLPSIAVKKSKILERLFSRFGTIESVRLRSIPIKADVKMPRRAAVISGAIDDERGSAHAYVVFKDEAAAEAALSLNMQLWEGAHLRVDRAGIGKYGNAATVNDQKGSTTGPAAYSAVYEPKRSVFLGNLTTTIEDEQVIKFFIDGLGIEAEKELEGVRIVRDPKTSLGKGIGFALFKSTNTRKAALSLDGRQLCGRPVRIMPVKSSKDSDRKLDSKSWQGMKSKKKATVRTQSIAFSATKLKHQGGKKERHGKRPAVAARKARQLASKN